MRAGVETALSAAVTAGPVAAGLAVKLSAAVAVVAVAAGLACGDAAAKARVLSAIFDHNLVFATFRFLLEKQTCPPRTLWCNHTTDWDGLNAYLSGLDFSFLSLFDVHTATEKLTQTLLHAATL